MNNKTNIFEGIKVGDVVLVLGFRGWIGMEKMEVTKVTPAFFWVGSTKFRISNGDEFGGKWGNDHKALVYTDEEWNKVCKERKDRERKNELVIKLRGVRFDCLPLEFLEKYNSVLEEYQEYNQKRIEKIIQDLG